MQLYVVRPKVDKTGEEEKKSYYGVPVSSGQITEEDLAKEVCEQSSLTEADVISAIYSLKRLMHKHLVNGYQVRLKGIGTFSVSATSEGFDTPEACTPVQVKAKRVCFKADNEMRSVLERIKYKKSERPGKV